MHDVHDEVGALARLDLFELRGQWERRFGPAPRFRSVELFRLMLAWRLQAEVSGGLDLATRKGLRLTGAIVAEGQDLGVGATLRRCWNSEDVVVTVVEGGFRWNEQTYKSLSAVASAITGSRWNGPRFFGLRQ